MKQKLLLALFALLTAPTARAYDAEINGIYYNFSGNEATVTSGSTKYSGSVVIPESVTFNDQTYSVTSIGNASFQDCLYLNSVSIPESVTSIGNAAFSLCGNLRSVCIPESVTSISNDTFNRCENLISITLPESITSIGNWAFAYCRSLTSINIPKAVTSIGETAFTGCSALTSVTIPENVTSIGRGAFETCNGLTSIIVESGNATYDSRNDCNAIIETASNTLLFGCQNTIIPNTVTSIGDIAFEYCVGLTSIAIPESVTSIGQNAFSRCVNLTSLTIPESVTTIGLGAFSSCSGLTSVTIPESVTTIGESVFNGCSGLKSITIPNSVTSIGRTAFAYCSGLTDVYCYAENVPNTHSMAFNRSPIESATLHVPAGSIDAYKGTAPWKKFGGFVQLGEVSYTIAINETNFPDENFRSWLLSKAYGADGVLTEEEIAGIKSIDVSSNSIQSLKGVEYFTALTQLRCYFNQLSALDVSHNTALTELYCANNQLTSLDVSQNIALNKLSCAGNQLTSLDVSQNTALTWLSCSSNQLTSLDVSKNTALTGLQCYSNQLTTLDLSQNTKLRDLHCYLNRIKGAGMDALVESLPTCSVFNQGKMYVVIYKNAQNVMTTTQVAAAKAKWWMTYYDNGMEYEGSEPVNPTGDLNGDGKTDIADAVSILNLMAEGADDSTADLNGDGKVDIADLVSVLDLMAGQ